MRRILVGAFSLALIGGASANDKTITMVNAIEKCWEKPVSAEVTPYKVTLLIKIDSKGSVLDINAKSYPKSPEGKMIVRSLSRAIQRCEPYSGITAGEIEVTLSSNVKSQEIINPLK